MTLTDFVQFHYNKIKFRQNGPNWFSFSKKSKNKEI